MTNFMAMMTEAKNEVRENGLEICINAGLQVMVEVWPFFAMLIGLGLYEIMM